MQKILFIKNFFCYEASEALIIDLHTSIYNII